MNGRKRRITSNDVAREAGVSQATVSYVLNNDPRQTIPEETRERVLAAANKLGYQPYAPARSLRLGTSNIILVVWAETVVEASFVPAIEALAEAVGKIGFSLLWQLGFSPDQEQLSANLSPALIVALVDTTNPTVMTSLQRFGAPIISIGGEHFLQQGARAQAEHLFEQQHGPVVYAATSKPQLQMMNQVRQEAVRQVCQEKGQTEMKILKLPQNRHLAVQTVADFLKEQKPPFSICAYNDDVALAALAALSDLGIQVPGQVRVIGHDNTGIAELSIPPLTTIGLETPDFGQRLIASVMSVCQGGPILDSGTFRAKVIVRSTT